MRYSLILTMLLFSYIQAQTQVEYDSIVLKYQCLTNYSTGDLHAMESLYELDNEDIINVKIKGKDAIEIVGTSTDGDTIFIHSDTAGLREVYFPSTGGKIDFPESLPDWKIIQMLDRKDTIGDFITTAYSATADGMVAELWLSETLFNVDDLNDNIKANYFVGDKLIVRNVGQSNSTGLYTETQCTLTEHQISNSFVKRLNSN